MCGSVGGRVISGTNVCANYSRQLLELRGVFSESIVSMPCAREEQRWERERSERHFFVCPKFTCYSSRRA